MTSRPVWIGTDPATGAAVLLDPKCVSRGVYVEGVPGAGKTSLYLRWLASRYYNTSFALFDYAGTGVTQVRAMIAALSSAVALGVATGDLAPWRFYDFVERFPTLVLDASNRVPAVRIDLLARHRLADGSVESVEQVVHRVLAVIADKFDDPAAEAKRVTFRKVATAVLACLVAAHRGITELHAALEDPAYVGFLDRELDRYSRVGRDAVYVATQRRVLQGIYDKRALKPGARNRDYEDEVGSTVRAFNDFRPGTMLGTTFDDGTIDLGEVAFANSSLLVTTTITDPHLRALGFRAIHSLLHSLLATRPLVRRRHRRVTIVLDEAVEWVPGSIHQAVAMARNFRASYWIIGQHPRQWDHSGLPWLREILPALCRLTVRFRPASFAAAQEIVFAGMPIDPLGMILPLVQTATSDTTSWGATLTDSWGRAEAEGWDERESDGTSWGRSTDSRNGCSLAHHTDGSPGDTVDSTGLGASDQLGGSRAWQSGRTGSRTDQAGGSCAASAGGSHTETCTTLLHVATFLEQVAFRAQALLRDPDHRASITYAGQMQQVDLAGPPELPPRLLGVDPVSLLRRCQDRLFEARAVPRVPYDPVLCLPATVAPPPAPTEGASTPHTTPRHGARHPKPVDAPPRKPPCTE